MGLLYNIIIAELIRFMGMYNNSNYLLTGGAGIQDICKYNSVRNKLIEGKKVRKMNLSKIAWLSS